jgi:hypothetical protein
MLHQLCIFHHRSILTSIFQTIWSWQRSSWPHLLHVLDWNCYLQSIRWPDEQQTRWQEKRSVDQRIRARNLGSFIWLPGFREGKERNHFAGAGQ